MAGLGLSVSPGFLLLAAALYFVGGGAALTAFITAALAHELGHLAAILLTGASIRGIRVTAAGPVIEYSGALTEGQELWIVIAGPAAGLFFAILCFISNTPYYRYVGAVALLASMFNLLPVLPMDGGRIARYALTTVMPEGTADTVMRVVGTICALGVIGTGLRMASPAAAAAGIWMVLLANVPDLR